MGGRQGPANVRVALSVTGHRPTSRPRSGRGRTAAALRNRLGRATDSCGAIPARWSRDGPLAKQPAERRRRRSHSSGQPEGSRCIAEPHPTGLRRLNPGSAARPLPHRTQSPISPAHNVLTNPERHDMEIQLGVLDHPQIRSSIKRNLSSSAPTIASRSRSLDAAPSSSSSESLSASAMLHSIVQQGQRTLSPRCSLGRVDFCNGQMTLFAA